MIRYDKTNDMNESIIWPQNGFFVIFIGWVISLYEHFSPKTNRNEFHNFHNRLRNGGGQLKMTT